MKFFKNIKYFTKSLVNLQFDNFDKFFKSYSRFVGCNMSPYKKLIDYDCIIEKAVKRFMKLKKIELERVDVSEYSNNVLILSSEIYDTGGHTKFAMEFLKLLKDSEYNLYFCLTNVFLSKDVESAPINSEIIKGLVNDYYKLPPGYNAEKILDIFNYIIEKKITTIIVNIHMFDALAAAVIYLVKKYTNIKIVFINHGDHRFSLATNYADTIVTRCKGGKAITPYLKDKKNVHPFIIPYTTDKKEYEKSKYKEFCVKYGISQDAFITLTGCSKYKIGKDYFKVISRILKANKNIYHILITDMKVAKVKKFCKKYNIPDGRIINLNLTPDFDFYVQLADLYIDSFPQGSALTLLDCMKYSKSLVIKVNQNEGFKSFEQYIYDNYEGLAVTFDEVFKKVNLISSDKTMYNELSNKVYNYFIETYSYQSCLEKYKELIK